MGSAEFNIPTTKPKSVGSKQIEAGTRGNQQVIARVAGRRVYRVSRSRISLGVRARARAAASSIANGAPSWRSHSASTVGSSAARSPEGVERAETGKRPGNAGRVELEDLRGLAQATQVVAPHDGDDPGVVGQVQQRLGRALQQDLAAVPGAHQPGGPVDGGPEVVVDALGGVTGMDTHAHPQIGAGHRWEDGGHPVGVILSGQQLNEGTDD